MATKSELAAMERAEVIAAYRAFHGTNITSNGSAPHAAFFMHWVKNNGIESKAPQESIDEMQQEFELGVFY